MPLLDRSRNRHKLLCDVSWYKYKGVEPGLYNCPVVSKSYLDYPDGNFEFADNLEPVAINLVPLHWPKLSSGS